jgi:hypothetical protein
MGKQDRLEENNHPRVGGDLVRRKLVGQLPTCTDTVSKSG